MVKDCPKKKRQPIGDQADDSKKKKPRALGNVLAMIEQDANASNNVVTCTIYLFCRNARVLFDSDATHSFISMIFACYAS